ncbi:MAG: hypothetical protein GXP06_05600 [Alphaproteobacteria bacterium]|nr:hypothetical protein [Alphaproteobacteria bacterium]
MADGARLKTIITAVAAGCVISAAALAQSTFNYTAGLKFKTLIKGEVTASSIKWKCTGKACATSGPWPVPGVGACAALAEKVGEIAAYGHPGRKLSVSQLATCNKKAARQPISQTVKLRPQTRQAAPVINTKKKPVRQYPDRATPPPSQPQAFEPIRVRTRALTVTGTGALAALAPFEPVVVRTAPLTVTGAGSLAPLAPFEPVVARTPPLSVTGAE